MKLSLIFPARGNLSAIYRTLYNFKEMTKNLSQTEVLIAIDSNDEILIDTQELIINKFSEINLTFFIREQSDYFTRDYWNFLANQANGRFIVIGGSDCLIKTKGWDEIVYSKMDQAASKFGDDIIHGLIRDGLRRNGEDKLFPNFSSNLVLSKQHIKALGYLLDERYWGWGSDQVVTFIYKKLCYLKHQDRIISLVDVVISADDSMHVGVGIDDKDIEILKKYDKAYQKHLKISQEHPYTMTDEDANEEATKLMNYINVL